METVNTTIFVSDFKIIKKHAIYNIDDWYEIDIYWQNNSNSFNNTVDESTETQLINFPL